MVQSDATGPHPLWEGTAMQRTAPSCALEVSWKRAVFMGAGGLRWSIPDPAVGSSSTTEGLSGRHWELNPVGASHQKAWASGPSSRPFQNLEGSVNGGPGGCAGPPPACPQCQISKSFFTVLKTEKQNLWQLPSPRLCEPSSRMKPVPGNQGG